MKFVSDAIRRSVTESRTTLSPPPVTMRRAGSSATRFVGLTVASASAKLPVVFGCSSVYSFSYPNKFMLPMYNAKQHPPVTFEHSGVVSLRCNIHDHMLGYILVVDSMTVTKTDENGKA